MLHPAQTSRAPDGTDATALTARRRGSTMSGVDDDFGLAAAEHYQGRVTAELAAGTDLGGVTIVRLLAEGGMGRVYEGRQHAP
ncbi:MAG: hypothetical protein EBR23_11225, partial [Planctomycetia bacterium]|nr:hypothetical protein [Planctomycetia bacterium]